MAEPNPLDAFDENGNPVAAATAPKPASPESPLDAFDENGQPKELSAGQAYGLAEGGTMTGPGWDTLATHGPAAEILNAFGQGAADSWGTSFLPTEQGGQGALGAPFEEEAGRNPAFGMGDLGRAFNEAFLRPSAHALDLAMRTAAAATAGLHAIPPIGAAMEVAGAFPFGFHGMGAPGAFRAGLSTSLLEARRLGVIGPGGEAAWKGTVEPPPPTEAETAAAVKAAVASAQEAGQTGGMGAPPPETSGNIIAPETIHEAARRIAPDVFAEFDPLQERGAGFLDWIDELRGLRDRGSSPEIEALDQQIDDMRGARLEAPRQERGALADRITALEERRAGLVAAIPAEGDTPEMATVRQSLTQTRERMWDLAPQVSAAYRAAEAGGAEPGTEATAPAPIVSAIATVAPAATAPRLATPEPIEGFKFLDPNDLTQIGVRPGAQAAPAPVGAATAPEAPPPAVVAPISEPLTPAPPAPPIEPFDINGERMAAKGRTPMPSPANPPEPPIQVEGNPAALPSEAPPQLTRPPVADIAADVSQKLVAAGRPREEADAAAALVAAHYEARSANLAGTTPGQLYADEGPAISAGRAAPATVGELVLAQKTAAPEFTLTPPEATPGKETLLPGLERTAQGVQRVLPGTERSAQQAVAAREAEGGGKLQPKAPQKEPGGLFKPAEKPETELFQAKRGSITLRDGEATIRLFAHADASTFLHETGHQWLEELTRDAIDPRAMQSVRADAMTVRRWLGADQDAPITTRQHEKFARGFERYMMEGRAPSQALAGVFAKFKAWLTTIYRTVDRLRAPISDDIRRVFDRMLTVPEGAVTVAEREAEPNITDAHETAVAVTPPERAGAIADQIRADTDAMAGAQAPEVRDELEGSADRARRDAAASGGPHGNEPAPEPVAGASGIAAQPGALGPGGGEIAAESGGVRAPEGVAAPERPASLYVKLPRQPLRLTAFLKRAGGLRDEGGDLRQIIGGAKGRPGLLNRRGMTLDDAALLAWEEGYFPELGTQRPSIQQLLDAIEGDTQGAPRYSAHDDAAVQDYREAMARNAEVDRLANDLKIDNAGMSRQQFWDTVAERLSVEEQAREAEAMAAGREADFAEADRAAREWIEARGDAWEPDQVYDDQRPRTLEDLERERDAENENAARPLAGDLGIGEPARPAGPGESALQGSDRQGGRGPGFGRGDGAPGGAVGSGAAAERPTGPNDLFGGPRSDLVDKSGNIRLDKYNFPDDVRAVIDELAGENNDFLAARRGVVSDDEVLRLAASMGLKPEDLSLARLRAEYSPEKIRAVRELFAQTTAEARRLSLVENPTEADVAAYMAARSRVRMTQEYLSGITAETGRGLRAFRAAIPGFEDAGGIAQLMGDLSQERTLWQMRTEMKRVAQYDTGAQVAGFLRDSDKPGAGAMLEEIFKNWLIAGPITHGAYLTGGEIFSLWRAIPETAAQAAIGGVQRALGVAGAEASPRLGEVAARAYALLYGQKHGIKAAWASVKAGQTMPLPGEMQPGLPGVGATTPFTSTKAVPDEILGLPIPLGSIVRAPGERMIAPIHSYTRAVGYEESIAGQAYRAAAAEGLTGGALAARVSDLQAHPSLDMMQVARDYANEGALMGPVGAFTRRAQWLTNYSLNLPLLGPTRPLAFVNPFMRIASFITHAAVVERGIGMGPVPSLFSGRIRDDLLGRNGAVAQAETGGRLLAGTSLTLVGAGLAMEGKINRSPPSDSKERAVWTRLHGMGHSFQIGSMSFDLAKLGILGFGLGIAADLQYAGSRIGEDDAATVAGLVVQAFAQNFFDENFMRGPSDLLRAIDDHDRYGPQYVRNFFAAFAVPYSVGMGQVARQVDPYMREARSMTDRLISGIPWWSESLEPRIDVWGNPVPNRGWAGTYYERIANDPADLALTRLQYYPAPVERRIVGVALTAKQYTDYAIAAGQLAHSRVMQLLSMPGFLLNPEGEQRDEITRGIEWARRAAATKIKMDPQNYHAIVDTAAAAKKALLSGARRPPGGWPQPTAP